MNYYEHHLGDYMRDAGHLSMTEDGAYRRLLDVYYTRETPLPLDVKQCQKLARCATAADRKAVAYVLANFFEQREDGYHQKRCDEEIAKAIARIQAARSNGQKGGRPKAEHNPNETREEPGGLSMGSNQLTQQKALQSPPPTSQSPITRKRGRERRASRLPDDWELTPGRRQIAESERLDADRTFANFTDYWQAANTRGAVKRDWDAAWRYWCREERNRKPLNGNGSHIAAAPLRYRSAEEIEAEEITRAIAAGRSDEDIASDYGGSVSLERIQKIRSESARAQH